MTILSMNFWVLYTIFLATGIWLILWGLKSKKKAGANGFNGMGFGFSLSSTCVIGTCLFLSRIFKNFFTESSTPSDLFLIWFLFLVFAFLNLAIGEYIFRKSLGDQPDRAVESLKRLQKEQQQEVLRQLMAK